MNLGASGGSIRETVFEEIQEWSPEGVDIIFDPVGGKLSRGQSQSAWLGRKVNNHRVNEWDANRY